MSVFAARTTMSLPIADIGELPACQYVGLIDDDAVACLSVRLAAEGLLTPIWLRRNGNAAKVPWSVVAGRHRLRAATRIGWTSIDGEQRADAASGADELRALQVAENLDRRSLRPIELACHVMERWREAATTVVASEAHNQQSAAIRQRWSVLETVSNTPTGDRGHIDAATAAACAKSDKWVRIYRRLYETIVIGLPDLFAKLNAHPLGESLSAMTRLATLNDIARPQAAAMILQRTDWVSIDDALVAAQLAHSKGKRASADAHDERARDLWTKMSVPQRHTFAVAMAKDMPPAIAADMIASFRARGLL